MINNKNINPFHTNNNAFLFNIRNYLLEVRNIQRRKEELIVILLSYWGWIVSLLNKKWHRIFVLLYTANTKLKVGECYEGTAYSSDNNYFSFKKINWNIYFELFYINCRHIFFCKINQPLWINSKSIELVLITNFVTWNWQLWPYSGWAFSGLLLKICHRYPTMMKLSTVIPYLKKMQ